MFQRVMKRLVRFIELTYPIPKSIMLELIICNQAFDTKFSFSFIDEQVDAYRIDDVHWECFSDLACQGDGSSLFS